MREREREREREKLNSLQKAYGTSVVTDTQLAMVCMVELLVLSGKHSTALVCESVHSNI